MKALKIEETATPEEIMGLETGLLCARPEELVDLLIATARYAARCEKPRNHLSMMLSELTELINEHPKLLLQVDHDFEDTPVRFELVDGVPYMQVGEA